jgi:hypothetical protein
MKNELVTFDGLKASLRTDPLMMHGDFTPTMC